MPELKRLLIHTQMRNPVQRSSLFSTGYTAMHILIVAMVLPRLLCPTVLYSQSYGVNDHGFRYSGYTTTEEKLNPDFFDIKLGSAPGVISTGLEGGGLNHDDNGEQKAIVCSDSGVSHSNHIVFRENKFGGWDADVAVRDPGNNNCTTHYTGTQVILDEERAFKADGGDGSKFDDVVVEVGDRHRLVFVPKPVVKSGGTSLFVNSDSRGEVMEDSEILLSERDEVWSSSDAKMGGGRHTLEAVEGLKINTVRGRSTARLRDFTGVSGDLTYTLEITPNGPDPDAIPPTNGDVTVTAGTVTDNDGNTGPADVFKTAVWDAGAPTVTISDVPATIKTLTPFTAKFTWLEDVTGFKKNDVRVDGGTKGTWNVVSATVYTLEIMPDGAANVVVKVKKNAASDGTNDGPTAPVTATARWDASPVVNIVFPSSRINSTALFTATFEFDEDVQDFAISDVTVTGHDVLGSLTRVDDDTYTLEITPNGNEDVEVTVKANSVKDSDDNPGPSSAVTETVKWDDVPPKVVGVTGVPVKINSRTPFDVTIKFSEALDGDGAYANVRFGGTSSHSRTSSHGITRTWRLTPLGGQDVVVAIDAHALSDGINTGPASNVKARAVWDADAPTVTIGVPDEINSTTAFTATFAFSEPVFQFVSEDVEVTGGTKGTLSGSNFTTFSLLITPDGPQTGTNGNVVVRVNKDAATDGLNPGPTTAVSKTAIWNATPTVKITGVPSTINSTTAFTATFTWTEPVTGFKKNDVRVTNGTKGTFTPNPSDASLYTLKITPTGPQTGTNGDVEVKVKASSATAASSNMGPSSDVAATATWDAAPTVAITGVPSTINSTTAFTATFIWSEAVTGFDATDVSVAPSGAKGTFTAVSATEYTLGITPTSGSDVVVTVDANSGTDATLNTGPATDETATATWDAAPTVTITGVPSTINSTTAFTATFIWSEAVTGFDATDVSVAPSGAKGTFTVVSATEYTLGITPTSGSDVVVTVDANSGTDATLNTGPATDETATATWDAAPTVAITGVPSTINSTTAFTATFIWSEAVTGFDATDVSVAPSGAKGTFTVVSATEYTLGITPTSGSDVVVTVDANSGTDATLNTGPATDETATATWDAAPTVAITGVPSTINSTTAFTATFIWSEAVTGFDATDVSVAPSGAKGTFTVVSATEYTLGITPTSGSDVVVTVDANSGTDATLNTGPATDETATATWDAAPTVTITGVPSTINSTTNITATFTWSEAVSDFLTGDVTVTGGTKGAFTAESGIEYTLVVTPTSGSNVTVEVAANAATDGVNRGPASEVSKMAIWDAAAPTVTITGVPSTINSTTNITATFIWSEAVSDFLTGDVTVTGGTKGAFTAVSGTEYTLAITGDGCTGSGDKVTVTVEEDAAMDLSSNLGPLSRVTAEAECDMTVPGLSSIDIPATINTTDPFTATFVFSENVTGFEAGDVTVTGGMGDLFTVSEEWWKYTMEITPDGNANVVMTVEVDAVTDGANTGPLERMSKTAVWKDAPTVAITLDKPRINSVVDITATFTWTEAVTDFDATEAIDVTVMGGTKGAFTGTGDTYDLVIKPDGDVDVVVTVKANAAMSSSNRGPINDVTETARWDAPTVSIGIPGTINSTANIRASFMFSESVIGFDPTDDTDVTVTGGTKGVFTGTGNIYDLVITPDGGADVVVTVKANAATGGFNNPGPINDATETARWDAPTLDIIAPATISSTAAFPARFKFTEDVTGFDDADVTVTGGSKVQNSFSMVDASEYTLQITPNGNVDVVVTVRAGAVTVRGHSVPASAQSETVRWDAIPTLSINVPGTISSTATFPARFKFTEDVTGFDDADVTVTGGSKVQNSFSMVDASEYTLQITPNGNVDVVVTVRAGAVTVRGHSVPASAQSETVRWDAIPTLSINVPGTISSTATFPARFKFTEDVTGFDDADVTVTGGSKVQNSFSMVDASEYTLQITPNGNVDVVVTVRAGAVTVQGHSVPASAQSETVRWDAIPTLSINVPGTISSTATFPARFKFTEDVTGFDDADVTVTGGSKVQNSFSMVDASEYTLQITPNGNVDVVVTVRAGAVTVRGHSVPASAQSETVRWDAIPTLSINVPGTISSTATFPARFKFTEDVTGFDDADVTVTGGSKVQNSFSIVDASEYTLQITPNGNVDVVVTVRAGAVTVQGHGVPASAQSETVRWDAIPTLDIIAPATISSTAMFPARFKFTEDVTGFDDADVTVTGGSKVQNSFSIVDASEYTLQITPNGNVDVVVTVAANSATNGVNTGPASEVSATAVWDAEADNAIVTNLSVALNFVEEGKSVTVTATLSDAQDTDVTIPLTVANGTAVKDEDYEASPPVQITINAGETRGNYSISTVADKIAEDDETFTVALGPLPSELANGEQSLVKVTIIDDDEAGINTPPSVSVVEGGTQTFQITLTSKPLSEVTVMMTLPTGSLLTYSPPHLTFSPADWDMAKSVTLTAGEDDTDFSSNFETLTVTANGGGYEEIAYIPVTITDNDAPGIDVRDRVTVPEGGSEELKIALARSPSGPVVVTITRNTNPDLMLDRFSLTFTTADWQTPKTMTLTATEDDDFETDSGILLLTASGGGYDELIPITITVTIAENDAAGLVVEEAVTMEEGGTHPLEVRLLAQPSGPVTVTFSGHAGTDLSLSDTPLTFTTSNWNQAQTVTLTAAEDEDYETDTIELNLAASGGGYNGEEAPVTVTITDNDERPGPLTITIYDKRELEDAGAIQLPIELSRPTDVVVTVQYASTDGTAESGLDYTASRGIVIFDPGATQGVIEIEITDDEIPESTETFAVTLLKPQNAIIARGTGTGTILDNDGGTAILRVEDALVQEEEGMVRFQVSLSHPQRQMISAAYRTQDGTAKAGEDYEAASGVVTLAPGTLDAMIAVPLLKDGLDWQEETFTVHLESSENAEIAKAVGVATIQAATTVSQEALEAYTARFVRTSATQVVEALGDRFRGADGTACGAATRAEMSRLWYSASSWDPSLGELLGGCRMSATSYSGSFSVWGRGAFRQFNGREDDGLTLDGEVTTGMLGADYRWKGGWLAGVLLSHSQGEGSFAAAQESGEITAGLTGVYPYVSVARAGWEVWLSAGAGRGQAEVLELDGDLTSRFGAMGVRGTLVSNSTIGLNYHGDVLVTDAEIEAHAVTAEVYRVRAGVEANARINNVLRPYVEANVRSDGGSAETGVGLEFGGGMRIAYPAWRLKADVHAQGLVMHTAAGFSEWGISGFVQVGNRSEGLMMRVRPSWGLGQGMSLYGQQTIRDAAPMGTGVHRTELELGYGIPWKDGTARSIMGVTQLSQGRMYRLGGELHPWERLTFSVFGLAHSRTASLGDIGVNVRGSLQY